MIPYPLFVKKGGEVMADMLGKLLVSLRDKLDENIKSTQQLIITCLNGRYVHGELT